jgi:RND family efflux transporter MFP subunit
MSVDTYMMPRPASLEARRPAGAGLLFRFVRALLMYLLPVVVVVGGVIGAKHLVDTAPKAERRPMPPQATPVRVEALARTSARAGVQVMGEVIPSRRITLQPRVNGEIVRLSPQFVAGGRFTAGEFMLQIDPKDYELALQQARSQVAQAQYELKVEQGHQEIARREWDLLNLADNADDVDRELALREPHLIKAKAALQAAEAAVREAQLALERTVIEAPFNCMVADENIDLGSQVAAQTQLATLVGTDEYWIRAAVPVDQLQWIEFPGKPAVEGSPVDIRQELGTGVQGEWQGQVVRLMSGLEPQGRMAQVLVSVPDPLRPGGSDWHVPLLIGAYVNVTIQGRVAEDVFTLPRTALRDGQRVWIMNEEAALEIRDVQVVWRNRDSVLVRTGLREGERLVVSELAAPVAGMALVASGGRTPQVASTRPATHLEPPPRVTEARAHVR